MRSQLLLLLVFAMSADSVLVRTKGRGKPASKRGRKSRIKAPVPARQNSLEKAETDDSKMREDTFRDSFPLLASLNDFKNYLLTDPVGREYLSRAVLLFLTHKASKHVEYLQPLVILGKEFFGIDVSTEWVLQFIKDQLKIFSVSQLWDPISAPVAPLSIRGSAGQFAYNLGINMALDSANSLWSWQRPNLGNVLSNTRHSFRKLLLQGEYRRFLNYLFSKGPYKKDDITIPSPPLQTNPTTYK